MLHFVDHIFTYIVHIVLSCHMSLCMYILQDVATCYDVNLQEQLVLLILPAPIYKALQLELLLLAVQLGAWLSLIPAVGVLPYNAVMLVVSLP